MRSWTFVPPECQHTGYCEGIAESCAAVRWNSGLEAIRLLFFLPGVIASHTHRKQAVCSCAALPEIIRDIPMNDEKHCDDGEKVVDATHDRAPFHPTRPSQFCFRISRRRQLELGWTQEATRLAASWGHGGVVDGHCPKKLD